MAVDARITLDQVHEGQELPALRYDVTSTTVVLGALAARDWRPMHHDYHFAVERQGTKDIFLSTPNQASWFERYVTDWTGPTGRLGRIRFRMRDSVYPGEPMVMEGVVRKVEVDNVGCGWAELDITMSQSGRTCTLGYARVALPTEPGDNPWARHGDRWRPAPAE